MAFCHGELSGNQIQVAEILVGNAHPTAENLVPGNLYSHPRKLPQLVIPEVC